MSQLYDYRNNYYVQLFYKDGPDPTEFDQLDATKLGCKVAKMCTLAEFKKYVS